MKFGKLPAVRDPRTLQLARLFPKQLPPIPEEYDFDTDQRYAAPKIPTPMFMNDVYGDCVIAGRAHLQLRFERREQGRLIPIKDQEVFWEWQNENGGTYKGLNMLSSLKAWRTWGWTAGGKQYKIDGWGELDPCATDHLWAGLYLLGPLYAGFDLPYAITKATTLPDVWDLTSGPDSAGDPEGGHCMIIAGASKKRGAVKLITWGREQWATLAWLEAYCTECYGVIDAVDAFMQGPPTIDVPLFREYLQQLAA